MAAKTPEPPSKSLRYPRGYLVLIGLSALDAICTGLILGLGGSELNPIADAVISVHGLVGMVLFKFALVTLAIVLCEEISRHSERAGRWVLIIGIVMTLAPVTIGGIELLTHHNQSDQQRFERTKPVFFSAASGYGSSQK